MSRKNRMSLTHAGVTRPRAPARERGLDTYIAGLAVRICPTNNPNNLLLRKPDGRTTLKSLGTTASIS